MILQCLIAAVVIGVFLYFVFIKKEEGAADAKDQLVTQQGVGNSSSSLSSTSIEAQNNSSASGEGHPSTAEGFPFDPNTADSATLVRLGLSPYQARNVLRYRAKGGQYHRPEDFKRLYGLTLGQWEHLAPYIIIGKEYQYLADQENFDAYSGGGYQRRGGYGHDGAGRRGAYSSNGGAYGNNGGAYENSRNAGRDGSQAAASDSSNAGALPHQRSDYYAPNRVQKLKAGEHIDLAKADTLTLQRVPGIGSYYARKIVEYGNKLGGFVSVNQLNDEALDFLPVGIEQWMTVPKSASPKKLHINKMTTRELSSHPYLTYYQAKQITERIRLYGPFKSWDDLLFLKEITEKDRARLEPYISFE